MNAAVLTDSTCDLDAQQAGALGIHIIPLNVQFDGRMWLDHQELDSQELFRRVESGAELPSTTPPSIEKYQDTLENLLSTHDHVYAVHLSSKLSETYQHATQAAQAFPGRVTVHDTWNSSGALALQAERAGQLLHEGLPPEQVSELLSTLRPQVHTHMCLSTLAYLQKNGRVGGAAALVGTFLHMKPIVGLQEGKVEAFAKPLGTTRAVNHMRSLLRQYAQSMPRGRVALFHNGHEQGVEALQHEARDLGLSLFLTLDLGTVLSAHGGPGVFGFSFEPLTIWHGFRAY